MNDRFRRLTINHDSRSSSLGRANRRSILPYNYSYLIDFCIDPVEFGFFCDEDGFQREFKGLGALNQYFERLVDNHDVYDFADVWDGYYRITLVQFQTDDDPFQLKKTLNQFSLTATNNTTISEPLFQSWKLDVNRSHNYRLPKDFRREPVALYFSASQQLKFESILREIKRHIRYTEWQSTSREDLHMNIRLYMGDSGISNQSTWTWERVCQLAIPDKVAKCPIIISRSRLEVILKRSDCIRLYEEGRYPLWWSGVTELNNQCSGCNAPTKDKQQWRGVCYHCHQYERIEPIWSHSFSGTVKQTKSDKYNCFNELMSEYELWKKQTIFDDTFTLSLTSNVPTLIAELLQHNFSSDLFFVQSLTINDNSINQIPNVIKNKRNSIYHRLSDQMGFFYDSDKLEPVIRIDTSDFIMTSIDNNSEKSIQIDPNLFDKIYAVLLRRKYGKQIQENDHPPVYSFIVMSYHAPAVYLENSKKEINDFFWKCVSQIHQKIQSLSNDPLPMIIIIYQNTIIDRNNEKTSQSWICSNNQTTKDTYLFYYSSNTYPNMIIDELHDYDIYSKSNYTDEQWKQYDINSVHQQDDSTKTINKKFNTAFIGFNFKR